jgi:hypothetical protein
VELKKRIIKLALKALWKLACGATTGQWQLDKSRAESAAEVRITN